MEVESSPVLAVVEISPVEVEVETSVELVVEGILPAAVANLLAMVAVET